MNVLLVDDHPLFRSGLKMLLSDLDPALVCLQADGLRGAAVHAPPSAVAIELVLYGVPDDGAAAARLSGGLRELFADAMLIALADVDDAALARRCVQSGASGVVAKGAPAEVLVHALRAALQGQVTLPASLIESAGPAGSSALRAEDASGARVPYDATGASIGDGPDEFDQELLWLSIRGLSVARIAERCALSRQVVEHRLARAYRSIGAADRADAMIAAAALGLRQRPGAVYPSA